MNDLEDSGKFTENEIKKKAFWSRKKGLDSFFNFLPDFSCLYVSD
ncbi:hypothetical protein R4Z10_08070 [Niallia sp. XMNu-256]